MISRAIFMILLILSLPVIHAASISQTYVVGSAGLNGYAKPGDQITYHAIIDTNGDEAGLASRVFRGSSPFTECTQTLVSSIYDCVLTQTLTSQVYQYTLNYDVTLKGSDETVPPQQMYGSFLVDSAPPKVTLTTVGQVGKNITASFGVLEELSAGYSQICTNISKVELLIDNQIKTSITPTNTGCTYADQLSFEVSGTGQKQVCVKATDGIGNIGQACKAVTVDLTKPVISNIGFLSGSVPTTFISPVGSVVRLKFTIDKVVSSASATVDGNQVSLSCTTTCTSSNLVIQPGAHSVVVSVVDLLGNENSVTQSITVSADTTAPVIESLSTGLGAQLYANQYSIVNVTIVESESGVEKETVFLNGNPADSCSKSANKWNCGFVNVGFTGDGNKTLTVSGYDIVGNQIASRSFNVTVDNTAPVVSNVRLRAIGLVGGGSPVVASGGRVVVNATVIDASPLTFVGNFTLLEGGVVVGTCQKENCTVTSQSLGVGPLSLPAQLIVSDIVGNNVTVSTDIIEILQTSEGETNYFTHTVKLQPAKIELSTSAYINQRGYAQITIVPKPGATVFDAQFDGPCYNVNRTGSVGDRRLFQNINQTPSGKVDLVQLALLLKATQINQSKISVVCDITVSGRYETYYVAAEKEQVLITFDTFNLSVGTLDDSYQKLLDERTKIAKNHIGAKLESFEKLFDIASKLCRLFRVIFVGISLVQVASSVPGHIGDKTAVTGFLAWLSPAFWAQKAGLCFLANGLEYTATNTMMNALNSVCQFVNCEWSIGKTYDSLKKAGNNAAYSSIASSEQKGGVIGFAQSKAGPGYISSGLDFIDPQSTLAGAVLNLCIPGIIKNLRKAQQIECQYAVCLRDEVPNGIPVEACTQAYDFNKCVYVSSNIMVLSIIPAIISFWVNQFKALVADPFAVVGIVWVAGACGITCPTPPTELKDACVVARMAQAIGGLIKNIIAIKDDWRSGNDYEANDYCSQL